MPLKIGRYSFWRHSFRVFFLTFQAGDVGFYAVSVLLLYHALQDREIDAWNVASLLLGGVVYVLTVVFSRQIRRFFRQQKADFHHKRMRSSQSESRPALASYPPLMWEHRGVIKPESTCRVRRGAILTPKTRQEAVAPRWALLSDVGVWGFSVPRLLGASLCRGSDSPCGLKMSGWWLKGS